jgi:acetyl esterase/lipase
MLAFMIFAAPALMAAQVLVIPAGTELPLWPGTAPGTSAWKEAEVVTTSASGDRILSNVSHPTLSVYLPAADLANGTAVVIAPGGALRVLGVDNEGTRVAQWLNSKGIAAFVLKYRTLQQSPRSATSSVAMPAPATAQREELTIRKANANPAPGDEALDEVLRMAVADAQAALRLVRSHAAAWRIDPARVGFMGFSAGGGVGIGTVLAPQSDASPDFLATLYGPSLMDVEVPAHAPPLFIAVGTNHFNVASGCIALFSAWKAAGKPVEIHVYDQVSGGFGMTRRGLPVDAWTERFLEWLVARKLATP